MAEQWERILVSLLRTARRVILEPVEFYRTMPRGGGYWEPWLFMVGMVSIMGLLQALLAFAALSYQCGIRGALGLTFAPFASPSVGVFLGAVLIVVTFYGFLGATIVFVIWQLLGSQEPYETAYRSFAYTTAICPLAPIVGLIPYVGALMSILWLLALLITASIIIHRTRPSIS